MHKQSEILVYRLGEMVKSLALRYGITQNAASQICLGTTWKHCLSG